MYGLGSVGKDDEMPFFLDKLGQLSEHAPLDFKANVVCLQYQYTLFPYLDKGDFLASAELMNQYKATLYDKENWLNPIRKSELLLYTSLRYIGNQDFKAAKRYISNAMIDHNIKYLPLMRTIRLVRLIVYYETKDFEWVQHESRSIQRNLSSSKEQTFRTEHIVV